VFVYFVDIEFRGGDLGFFRVVSDHILSDAEIVSKTDELFQTYGAGTVRRFSCEA